MGGLYVLGFFIFSISMQNGNFPWKLSSSKIMSTFLHFLCLEQMFCSATYSKGRAGSQFNWFFVVLKSYFRSYWWFSTFPGVTDLVLPSWVKGDFWENVQLWPENKKTLPNHVFCIDFCFFSVLIHNKTIFQESYNPYEDFII